MATASVLGTFVVNIASAILRGVHIIETLQLSQISIATSDWPAIENFRRKKHLLPIFDLVEEFHFLNNIIFLFPFISIHKKFLA